MLYEILLKTSKFINQFTFSALQILIQMLPLSFA